MLLMFLLNFRSCLPLNHSNVFRQSLVDGHCICFFQLSALEFTEGSCNGILIPTFEKHHITGGCLVLSFFRAYWIPYFLAYRSKSFIFFDVISILVMPAFWAASSFTVTLPDLYWDSLFLCSSYTELYSSPVSSDPDKASLLYAIPASSSSSSEYRMSLFCY